jgi:hypothetical protein
VPPKEQYLPTYESVFALSSPILLYVPTARSCSVSFTDAEGITHAVEITASTLFEAAVVAMAEFRRHGFAETTFGPATKLNVRVKAPEAAHVVSVARVKSWLDRVAKSPSEQVEKNRLKYLLTR